MYDRIICVTNRKLVDGDFIRRIREIEDIGISSVILREKDLDESDYEKLAESLYSPKLIIHTHTNVAKRLGIKRIHLTLSDLEKKRDELVGFTEIGTSCHSCEDVKEAEKLGASYCLLGHIFDTDCKKGLPGRGLPFLIEVMEQAVIPVYAIGGISEENIEGVLAAGSDGVALMSGFMRGELGWIKKRF